MSETIFPSHKIERKSEFILKLDNRLRKIADLVPQGVKLADIGTDHAYLPAALLMEKKISFAVAADVAVEPCQVAKTTLAMYGLTQCSEVRQGDGLKVLQPDECNCVVMAGMGGSTIVDILTASPEVAHSVERLILQPMQGANLLRQFLCVNGYEFLDEELVEDGKYLYEIIVVRHRDEVLGHRAEGIGLREEGRGHRDEGLGFKVECLIGPVLLQKKHPLLPLQFAKQKAMLNKILRGMERSGEAVKTEKYQQCKALLAEVEKWENAC